MRRKALKMHRIFSVARMWEMAHGRSTLHAASKVPHRMYSLTTFMPSKMPYRIYSLMTLMARRTSTTRIDGRTIFMPFFIMRPAPM